MGQALYRKHRPKSLSQVIGQEHITDTLLEALKQGRISHAYLLTGPRGIGKTSVARILAHEINQLPYTDDSSHLDIIEIDAASNRRIDEIRDLREKVYIAPSSAKYKVYIIDEVHMLTREAFNALLKTLEEPPAHVVFILATTEPHKLPDTIVSRTQRYSFKPVESSKVADQLAAIAKAEGIKVTRDALLQLASHGEGSFRDSISLLDQASNSKGTLDEADVLKQLGIPPTDAIQRLLLSLGSEPSDIAVKLQELYEQGYQAVIIAKQLGITMRQQFLHQSLSLSSATTLDLMAQLLEVPASHDPERYLEILLLRTATMSPRRGEAESTRPVQAKKLPKRQLNSQPDIKVSEQIDAPADEAGTEPASEPETMASKPLSNDIWPEVLKSLKQRHNTVYSIVRMAEPDFAQPGKLRLAFGFAFHQKRINQSDHRQLLADVVETITGNKISVECIVKADAAPPKISVSVPKNESLDELTAISNIFGDAELLES